MCVYEVVLVHYRYSYTCVCTYIFIHVCVHLHIFIHIYTYIPTERESHTHTHTPRHTYMSTITARDSVPAFPICLYTTLVPTPSLEEDAVCTFERGSRFRLGGDEREGVCPCGTSHP